MLPFLIVISLIISCSGDPNSYDELKKMMARIHPRLNRSYMLRQKNVNTKEKLLDPINNLPSNPNLNKTYFCDIEYTEQKGAIRVKERDYPWIARVVHSVETNVPLLCTAAAVKKMIFISAGTCIARAKVTYTRVLYHGLRLRPKAFVLPSKPSRQMFDDIGWVVVHPEPGETRLTWKYINVIKRKRTDEHFFWFENLGYANPENTVVGFVAPHEVPSDQNLYILDKVLVSNHLCHKIVGRSQNSDDYWVPCYLHCTHIEHESKSPTCDPHLIGVGHMVLNKDRTLIGVASWSCDGPPHMHYEYFAQTHRFPVGMAVPNSDAYNKDGVCATRIRDGDETKYKKGYYRTLCDST